MMKYKLIGSTEEPDWNYPLVGSGNLLHRVVVFIDRLLLSSTQWRISEEADAQDSRRGIGNYRV